MTNRWARVMLAAVAAVGCRTDGPRSATGPGLDVARERAAYLDWLADSPISPLKAVARVALVDTVRIGPPLADIPLEGVAEYRLVAGRGGATLETDSSRRAVAPYVPVVLADYRLTLQGVGDNPIVLLFGPADVHDRTPEFYPIDTTAVYQVELQRSRRRAIPMLTLDGIEVKGTVVGKVTVPLGEGGISLEVRHVPDPGTEESELAIYFRDQTNDDGSYPAGRFVTLEPTAGDRYRLDFNRARSPFCAYSTIYPCPLPWRGNDIAARVEAGEKYHMANTGE